jgi:hypothetical protein
MRTVALHEARTADEVWALIGANGARTLVFDVEPLVALWDTGTAVLDAGVTETLRQVALATGRTAGSAADPPAEGATAPPVDQAPDSPSGPAVGLETVLFSTNSSRIPTALPGLPGVRVGYRASAGKPLHTGGYRALPGPGMVIGDQIVTDGALAWRLGFDFVYFRPERDRIPLAPRFMGLLGVGLRPLLFRSS